MGSRFPKKAKSDPFWDWMSGHPDMLGALQSISRGPGKYKLPVGLANGSWNFTDPRQHVLVLGPSQGTAGKTASLLIPGVLCHHGPVLTSTTKWDIPQATAMARSRLGDVWWYDPSGGPTPPGFKELRFSPVIGAEDWTTGRETAHDMVEAAAAAAGTNVHASRNSEHFDKRSAQLIAVMLHIAAVTGRDIGWIVDVISAADKTELQQLEAETRTLPIAPQARRVLIGIFNTDPRERSGYFTTADTVLDGYQGRGLRVARDVNFKPAAFVMGRPDQSSDLHVESSGSPNDGLLASVGVFPRIPGRYDTIYVSIPVEKQRIYAPQLIILVGAVQRATYALARQDQMQGFHGRPATLLALDEMYGAPVPKLPQFLAEGAGQNLLLLGCLQDLAQAVDRWGKAGDGFLTLWQVVVALHGLANDQTNELLSKLGGEYDHPTVSHTSGPMSWSENRGHERRRRLPFEVISRGDPQHRGQELIFTPEGWQWFYPMRYFGHSIWPWILTQSAEWSMKATTDNRDLPLPDLARGGDYSLLHATGGPTLANWFWEVGKTKWEFDQRPPRKRREEPPDSREQVPA